MIDSDIYVSEADPEEKLFYSTQASPVLQLHFIPKSSDHFSAAHEHLSSASEYCRLKIAKMSTPFI